MNTIIGTYECKVDAKGRLMVPAPLKKQIASSLQDGFVMKRSVFQQCIELYPMKEWEVMMKKINKLNRFKNQTIVIRFLAYSRFKTVQLIIQKKLSPHICTGLSLTCV